MHSPARSPQIVAAREGDGEPGRVRPSDPVGVAFRAALAEGCLLIDRHAPGAVEGRPEAVHQLRIATRRLRAALWVFRGLGDPGWSAHVAGELKWLGGALGGVRDVDVMLARLEGDGRGLDGDTAAALAGLLDELRDRHRAASEALREALGGERFAGLTADLAAAAASGEVPEGDGAEEPCRKALPRRVARAWKRLKRDARALGPESPDEAFHDVRKRAKRARYAAEAARRGLRGSAARDAQRFALAARDVQDVLGTHQDASIAADLLASAAAARPDDGPFNFAAGRLLEHERTLAAAARERFGAVWHSLDRPRLVRWLHV